ncbi:MAG TPA: bifunctional methylenetetrahydrofolate dehydrogenase/methenyltetrahydrofolate cyclohydrolase FolD [Stellaceae bacterium]|nr:bifunctional methylenetetrahydrofolate dehydrogenase/methenyltetrahydrofolate cyclohydrolase FolD [Stellaceae bacterium]
MSEARIIDGRAAAASMRRRTADTAARLARESGIVPGLATLLVGDDPASLSYIRSKGRAAGEAGFACCERRLPADTAEAALVAEVGDLAADDRIDAILVQLPLPPGIDASRVIAAIDPAKDVDGFHPLNIGRLWSGLPGLVPCTPQACLRLLRDVHADLAGAEAVVIGRSNIVGKPMAALLLAAGCTVTLVHSQSRDAAAICRRADILVAAAGRAHLVTPDWIKPGATVIDVGINPAPAPGGGSRIVGDVDFARARAVAGAITPVPGGVGPMTIAYVLYNTLLAACRRRGLGDPPL